MAKTSVIGMGFRRMDDGKAAGIWRDIERNGGDSSEWTGLRVGNHQGLHVFFFGGYFN